MILNNNLFYFFIVLCFVGYFVFRFGMISRGRKRSQVETSGGFIIMSSLILVVILISWKALLLLILVFFFLVTPVVEVIISKLYKKLYGVTDERVAKKYNTTKEDVVFNTYTNLDNGEDTAVKQVSKELLDKYNNK